MDKNQALIEELVEKSHKAQEQFSSATQEQADAAVRAICYAIYAHAEELAQMAVKETRMGNVKDKISKNSTKSKLIWNSLRDKKSVGIIRRIPEKKMIEIAKPMGVVASIIPCTNPIVTPMSNAAFALKCRNSIIYSPHPRAKECTKAVVAMFREELNKLGLPEDLIQTIEEPSVELSGMLMKEADVIVATGGMGMVKSAYSSGKPAYGVGAGNVQSILDDDYDLSVAADDIILGRTFDNGIICLGEQSIIAPASRYQELVQELRDKHVYYTEEKGEIERLREALFPGGGPINGKLVGQDAKTIAEAAGIQVPDGTIMIAVKAEGIGKQDLLCKEKMCPVISMFAWETFEEAVDIAVTNLNYEGKGHSIGIHSNNPKHVEYAAEKCSVARVVVNQPAGTSGGGGYLNGFTPTTTLGCGSWGNNSFSGNLDYIHLMNITRVGDKYDYTDVPDDAKIWGNKE